MSYIREIVFTTLALAMISIIFLPQWADAGGVANTQHESRNHQHRVVRHHHSFDSEAQKKVGRHHRDAKRVYPAQRTKSKRTVSGGKSQAGSLMLFDEADSLFGSRGSIKDRQK